LAGTALPIDREALAHNLGFSGVSESALDAVMDRDFAIEFVSCCATIQTHFSRMAEDMIWLSTPEFGFFRLPEAFTTGSSLMPQKKNPDSLELVRGKAARLDGDLLRLLVLLKGLPAGYQKDLQEDKEAVFDAADTTMGSVAVMTGVVSGLALRREAMRAAAGREEMIAAGLAVALAREGMPFRRAHGLVGSLVAEAQKSGRRLSEVAAERLPEVSPDVAERLTAIFDPREAVNAKSLPGGTAPEAVLRSLEAALARVGGP
jgi:argininosuccinate lyase